MQVEVDIHALKRLAHNTREMSDLFDRGPIEFPALKRKFKDHHQLILTFVELVDEGTNNRRKTHET